MGGGSAAARTGKTKMTRQAKPFAHLKAKSETKAQALLRLSEFSRFGAMAQLFIINALNHKFGDLEYVGRETNTDKLKQALKFAPSMTIEAIEKEAAGVAGAGLEGVRESFAQKGASGFINPDAWHGVAVEIKTALDAAKA
ncbi:hypothetical protein CcrColossus_gp031 [Caulobacter phage CcrColossus]|uniref:Uncharacterized protein n=1 Tax=Caulobacter phage CcrColossus TaxID=1211640 RepID=K4JS38_9CAUD|nr:hypothetical protein CcrColossus_gp031 [Caulobacter phage CcrColossus]AFU87901.1 hypothetical protein CcrColossus_gp031 [Caulobacter phage CcrColossus]